MIERIRNQIVLNLKGPRAMCQDNSAVKLCSSLNAGARRLLDVRDYNWITYEMSAQLVRNV